MGNVITNLKAKFGVDTSDFKKGLKDGERAVADFKGAAGSQIEKFAEMFGINMGGVSDAIGTAGKSLNFIGQSFKGAAAGGNVFKIALTGVKLALVSTGVGAIVVALGSLIAYFQKSGRGADQFARILNQVKSVINNVIDRLAIFGKGIYEIATGKFKQGWETMKGAFQGIGQEIKNDWIEAGILADRLDKLDDKEIELITSLEERKVKAAELRLMAKEEIEDEKKKVEYLNKAAALYKSVYADQISVEKERLDIMKEQLAISAQDPTDEQRRAVAEQEAKIATLMREQAEQLKSLNRERKAADAAVRAELDLEVKKLQTLQLIDDKANISNIKMPDFSQITNSLKAPIAALKEVKTTMIDISEAASSSLESAALNVGEFLGALALGDAGIGDFAKVMAASFADLAVTIGKITIKAALAVAGIDAALKNPAMWPVALAAGVALVAIGSMVKGALASAAGGGGVSSASTMSSGGGSVSSAQPQNITISLTGKLIAEGGALVAVLNQENMRRKVST
jgi:hypothetical protein